MENMITKTKNFGASETKIVSEGKATYITGYANTKGHPDSYGDIPSGDQVYDLTRILKNPVAIADHVNSVGHIVGSFVELKEDQTGLFFKLRLMENPQTEIAKHAVEAYKAGYGVALSIGGDWYYGAENPDGTRLLTKAVLHHIALVAIGADENALTTADRPKMKGIESVLLADLKHKYGADAVIDALSMIEKVKNRG